MTVADLKSIGQVINTALPRSKGDGGREHLTLSNVPSVADPPRSAEPGWKNRYFAIVPANAFRDERLTNGEVRCLGLIASLGHSNYTKGPERICSIAQTTMARILKKPRQTINRWIKKLVECGYIEKIGQTKLPSGGNGANVYRVIGYKVSQDTTYPE